MLCNAAAFAANCSPTCTCATASPALALASRGGSMAGVCAETEINATAKAIVRTSCFREILMMPQSFIENDSRFRLIAFSPLRQRPKQTYRRAGRRRRRRLALNDFEGHKQPSRLLKTAAGREPDLGGCACSKNTLSLPRASGLVRVDQQQKHFSHGRQYCIAQGKEDKISI